MAKLTNEQLIHRFEATAKFHRTKANREWAYAKNGRGDEHYGIARRHYKKEKEFLERAGQLRKIV